MVRSKKREDILKRAVDIGVVEMVIADRSKDQAPVVVVAPAPVQVLSGT